MVGDPGFFPNTEYMVLPTTIQVPAPIMPSKVHFLLIPSVEFGPMPQVDVGRRPWLQMLAMSSWVIMFLTKWLKLEISTTPPPCSKTHSNQWPNSRKLLITALSVHYRKNLRNNEYEEIFSAREEGRWSEPPCLSEQSTFNSRPFLPPHKFSEPIYIEFYWGFTKSSICIQSSATGDWSQTLLSLQGCRKS